MISEMNYYNEFDPKAAAWLRELIKAGLIPPGDVDERSITEVKPHELAQYTQCHFFAGIGGWSLALQFAGWPVTRPVGTGSCPCQPFSLAGSQGGVNDDRHLWPVFFALIRDCRSLGQRWTDTIFGEQVESAIGHGWLDSVAADMEGEGYAVGAAVLGAHSVGAPHRRQRLYWIANAERLQQSREEQCQWIASGVGRFEQSFPWNRTWQCALRELRAVDDGISYGVERCDGPRNAIVPQVAAQFIIAAEEAMAHHTPTEDFDA